jgi:hypothetical protein
MDVGYGSLTNSLTLNPGSITDYYINNNNCNEVDDVCELELSFLNKSPIPTGANLGRIYIILPSELTPK